MGARRRPRAAVTAALFAILALISVLGPESSAQAADPPLDLGFLSVAPQAGSVQSTVPMFTTSAGCPAGSDSFLLHLSGTGLPSGGVVWTAGDAGFSSLGAFTVSSGLSLGDAAAGVIASTLLHGMYFVRLDCIAAAAPGVALASAVTDLTVDGSANHWTANANPPPGTSPPDPQSVQVTVGGGSLAISTPYTPDHPFDLGTLQLDSAGNVLAASAAFGTLAHPEDGITVVDTRPGVQGWAVSASATDFTDNSGHSISAEDLGMIDLTPVFLPGNALQSGIVVSNQPAAQPPVGPGDPGTLGLKGTSHVLALTDHGIGTVRLIGTMTLSAPTSTQPGTYAATVTFTII
jgi:hypothetical protein